MNAINVIFPYKHNGVWVFDDPSRGLDKEPFVCGIPAMLDARLDGEEMCVITFSARAFPGHQMVLQRLFSENEGNWYSDGEREGWLCPALFKYFDKAPEQIFVSVVPKQKG